MSSCDRLRRAWLAALASSAALAGCGFRLRGDARFPFSSIWVNSPSSPPFETEMRRVFEGAGALAAAPASAQVVLDVTSVTDDKQVLSLSSGGRVREFALAKRIAFRVHDKDGREWVPPQEIVIRRTYLYDDTQRLAREIQESRLLKEMQTDAVQQIVRQLQAVRAPA